MTKKRDKSQDVIPYRVQEAKQLGLHAAIILTQLRYWLERAYFKDDGHTWIHKSYRDLANETGLTYGQTRKGCEILETRRIVISTSKYSDARKGPPGRKWYTVDEDHMSHRTSGSDKPGVPQDRAPVPQNRVKETTTETTDTETTKPPSGSSTKKDPVPENGRPPCKHGHVHHGPCHDKLCREAGCFELVPKIKLGPSPLVDDEEGLENPF